MLTWLTTAAAGFTSAIISGLSILHTQQCGTQKHSHKLQVIHPASECGSVSVKADVEKAGIRG